MIHKGLYQLISFHSPHLSSQNYFALNQEIFSVKPGPSLSLNSSKIDFGARTPIKEPGFSSTIISFEP